MTSINVKYLSDVNFNIHAWAIFDRLALAKGFENNGMNLFKAETYVLNHQFPGKFLTPDKTSLTSVDFPINEYLSAFAHKVSGIDTMLALRILIWIYGLIGVLYLFRLAFLILQDRFKAMLIVILAFTSPIFLYYQVSSLPSIPALSLTIIGFYQYFNYLTNRNLKYWYLSICFVTIACLIRSSFVVPFFGLILFEGYSMRVRHERFLTKFLPLIIPFSLILCYRYYNGYLENTYGSMFLSKIMPPDDIKEFLYLVSKSIKNWFFNYFSYWHYMVFGVLILIYISQNKLNRLKFKINEIIISLGILIVTLELIFVIAMLKQFPDHDYYFLDSLYLPAMLLGIGFIKSIEFNFKVNKILIFILFTFPCIIFGINIQNYRFRNDPDNVTLQNIINFNNSKQYIENQHINHDAKLLFLDARAPNLPFSFLNRKGYALMITSKSNIEDALKWEYDFIIFQNDYFMSEIYSNFPDIINHLDIISQNKYLSICKYKPNGQTTDIQQFIKKFRLKLVNGSYTDFEREIGKNWKSYTLGHENLKNKSNSYAVIEEKNEYTLNYNIVNNGFIDKKYNFMFEAQGLKTFDRDFYMVITVRDNKNTVFYETINLNKELKEINKWQKISKIISLPKIIQGQQLTVYLWNKDKNSAKLDDVLIGFY